LDAVNLPQQALFGLLDRRPEETFLESGIRGTRANLRFKDILERQGLQGPASTVLGFAGDVLFDPAILLAGPAFRVAGKGIGLAGRLGVAGAKRFAPTISDRLFETAIKPIARRFSKTAFASEAERDLINLIDFEIGKAQNARHAILLEEGAAQQVALKLANRTNIPADDVLREIAREAERKTGIQLELAFPPGGLGVPPAQEALRNILKDLRQFESFQVLQSFDDKIIERALRKQGVVKPTPTQIAITKQIAEIERRNSFFGIIPEVQKRIKVKTDSQLAFPFGSLEESRKITKNPQVPLFVSASLEREFSKVDDVLRASAAEEKLAHLPADLQREIGQQATGIKARLENMLAREQSFGLRTQRLEDSTVDYLTHLTTPEAKQTIASMPNFSAFGRRFSGRHAFQLQRVLNESHPAIARVIGAGGKADIKTLNQLWREGKLFPQLGPQGSNLFVDNPFTISAVRRIRGEKAIADAQIIIKAANNPKMAVPRGTAPQHFRSLRLPEDSRLDALRNLTDKVRFDPDVASQLEQVIEKTLLPEGLDVFLKTFDTVQGIWKGITLAPFPAYHARNTVGNFWLNYLAGMGIGSVGFYRNAMRLQRGTLSNVTLGGKAYTANELTRLVNDFGIAGRGFFSGEVTLSSLKQLQRIPITAGDIPGIGLLVRKGFKAGTAIENNARIAHFMFKLDKGLDPMDAALSVKKYLFDYINGLTDFEQAVMRRIFPFYTFARFNIPLQAQAIVQNPRPFVRLSEIVNTARQKGIALNGDASFEERTANLRAEDRELLPEFVREQVGIPIRLSPSGDPEYFLLGGWLPAADLEVLGRPGGIADKMGDLLSPFIKEPVEQVFNFDLFVKRKIEQFPGQKQKFLGFSIRRRLAKSLRTIRILGDADRFMRAVAKDETRFTADQVSAVGTMTRFVFGLKAIPVSPEREARRQFFQRRETIRRLRSAARRGDEANVLTLREILERNRRR
jgi:predicted amidophosphoribosyltransferase